MFIFKLETYNESFILLETSSQPLEETSQWEKRVCSCNSWPRTGCLCSTRSSLQYKFREWNALFKGGPNNLPKSWWAPVEVPSEYANFIDIFSLKLTAKLPKHTRIYDYAIELVDDWQLLYGLIYSLCLETLKTYIEKNLASAFIKSFKSPARAPIFFNKKLNRSLRLCVNYKGLNNLTIKNQYPILLVRKSFNPLGRA